MMGGRYGGALYGALVGDCFGALFQESGILSKSSRLVLRKFLDSFEQTTIRNGKILARKKKQKISLFTPKQRNFIKIDDFLLSVP